ncbi:hypothetical protein BGZ80_003684 [Entomortierella chlamydospora]|uniref:RanBD1 domain-containing protein n=1 Tax=Entomortierella chlamydospora TaxID=101097 RepID=A0A9P6MP68_9FUNG|nr:hypothetical protein BGZ79_002792 [Entomortierella chlamydospora]KAG0008222.1 hypothetical protein BGZ80_003684 [Entomortierella chlamydospora]
MSKRGTENQITKDDYERGDDDESSSIMGTFRKASNDELAKRPIRTLRRLGAKTLSDQSDDGSKKTSAFASMGPLSTTPFPQPSLDPAARPNPFANISFGVPPATSTTTSTTTTTTAATNAFSSTPAPSTTTATTTTTATFTPTATFASTTEPPKAQPSSVFGGVFGQPSAKIESGSSTSSFSSGFGNGFGNTSSAPAFSNNAFTFNVGSNAKPLTMPDADSSKNPSTRDRESYRRALRGVNNSFLKKIQKEMEHNPTVNLAQIFQQYIDHRVKVRKAFRGIEEPRAIVLSDTKECDSNGGSPGGPRPSSKFTRTSSGSLDSPKMSFGLPVDITSGANKKPFGGFGFGGATTNSDGSTSGPGATTSLTAPTLTVAGGTPSGPAVSPSGFPSIGGTASMFGFGSSSMKGAVDPPKNPTSSAWNLGAPTSNTLSSSSTFPTTPSTTSSASGLFSSSTSANAVAIPKPFSFNPPPAPSGGPPKPFAFQVPPPVATTSSDATAGQEDSEKMPDDTQSQLVDNREGEEDEKTVFEIRAKLFSIINNEYKDLGVGQFRVNENSETKKRRMIMRTSGTGLITLNSWVIQGMPAKREKNNLTLFAIEEGKPRKFMLRVKEEQSAEELLQALDAGQNS